jgi:hypothetical protein
MRKLLLSFVLSAYALAAQYIMPNGSRLWKASLVSLATANALDVHSSWGKHELNGTLANPQGRFGTKGALIKLGLQGTLFGAEYLITRGHPSRRVYRVLTLINFGAAATFSAAAIRNYGIPTPPR